MIGIRIGESEDFRQHSFCLLFSSSTQTTVACMNPPPFPPRRMNVLVVDDDTVDRMLVVRSLQRSGLKLNWREASNIREARKIIQQDEFDCIFLDYRLPGGTGTQLLRELRDAEFFKPVIVVTSQTDPAIGAEVIKSGATDYISKDRVNGNTLLQVLQTSMRVYGYEKARRDADRQLRKNQELLK